MSLKCQRPARQQDTVQPRQSMDPTPSQGVLTFKKTHLRDRIRVKHHGVRVVDGHPLTRYFSSKNHLKSVVLVGKVVCCP